MKFLTQKELQEGLQYIQQSPSNKGVIELIVRRPKTDERELLEEAELDMEQGMIGDRWFLGKPSDLIEKQNQITLMNSRCIELLAVDEDRWALAGDQFYVDFDFSHKNLSIGSFFSMGDCVLEVTKEPHTGCKKFVERFGIDAMKFVNSDVGRELNLRGIHARVLKSGKIRVGDILEKKETPWIG